MRKILTAGLGALLVIGMQHHAGAGQPARAAAAAVTPVAGPSWLHRLGVDYRDSSLGRGAGRYGPNPQDRPADRQPVALKLESRVTISGGDLYRLNCQACHRAGGTGAPPEIKSVLPLVQGSSLQQMTATLRRQARQARVDLYHRIEKGGQRMPPREYLRQADVDALFTYLTTLAGRGSGAARRETIGVDRLGEFVVKGTCHICHDATGPRPTSEAILLQARIPSLASLLAEKPIADIVEKVRSGAPVSMGNPPFPHRGRMPVFYYLTDTEIVAAYMYLNNYPPK
jgi:mono/diheme cytochrome c family protein